jgi:hypothetical protein
MNAEHEHVWHIVSIGRYRGVWRCACGAEKLAKIDLERAR